MSVMVLPRITADVEDTGSAPGCSAPEAPTQAELFVVPQEIPASQATSATHEIPASHDVDASTRARQRVEPAPRRRPAISPARPSAPVAPVLTRRGVLVARTAVIAFAVLVATLVCVSLVRVATIPEFAAGSSSDAAIGTVVGGDAVSVVPAVGTAATGARVVTVLPGQTLWQIARALAPEADPRAVIAQIVAVNGLAAAGDIQAGQRLVVPPSVG